MTVSDDVIPSPKGGRGGASSAPSKSATDGNFTTTRPCMEAVNKYSIVVILTKKIHETFFCVWKFFRVALSAVRETEQL